MAIGLFGGDACVDLSGRRTPPFVEVMCSRFGWDDALGVSKEQFQELVGRGCACLFLERVFLS